MSDPVGTAGAVQYYVNSSTFGGDSSVLHIDTSDSNLTLARSAAASELTIKRTSTYTGTNSLGNLIFDFAGDSVAGIGASRDGADDAAALQLFTQATGGANTERMRITSAGNVGIGTDSPNGKLNISNGSLSLTEDPNGNADELVIQDDAAAGLSIITPNDNAGYIVFGDTDDSSRGQFIYDHSSDSLKIHVNNAERAVIDSSGQLGINETTPTTTNSNMLEVKSSSASVTSAIRTVNKDTSAGTAQGAALDFGLSRNSGAFKPQAGKIAVRRALDWTADDANIDAFMTFSVYENNALSEKMRINANGYVGIGTAGSYNGLHIKPASGNGQLVVEKASGASCSINAQSSLVQIGTITNHPLQLTANSTTYVHIKTSGDVGIGTTVPTAKLHVAGDALLADGKLIATNTSGNTGAVYNGSAATGDVRISGGNSSTNGAGIVLYGGSHSSTPDVTIFNTGSTERMRITSTGNVGIGTTSPTSPASVARILEIEDAQHAGIVLHDSTVEAWEIFANTGDLKFRYNNVPGSQTTLKSDGKIGLGTDSPTQKFDCRGNANFEGANVNLTINSTSSSPYINMEESGTVRYQQAYDTTNNLAYFVAAESGSEMWFGTANAEKMRIDSSGRLGIGTNAPDVKLHIQDTVLNNVTTKMASPSTMNDAGTQLRLENLGDSGTTTDIGCSLVFENHGVRSVGAITSRIGGTNKDTSILSFWTHNSTEDAQERITIIQTGDVGINTTNPSHRLAVYEDDGSTIAGLFKTNQTDAFISFQGSGTSASSTVRIGANGDDLNAYVGGAYRLTVLGSNGNVGIVNTSPTERLDVNGNALVRGNITAQSASGVNTSIVSTGATANLTVQAGEANIATIQLSSDDGDDAADITILEQSNGGPFKIKTNNGGSTAISCDSGGNVAINQATASYALDVNGVINCTSLRFADGTSISTTPTGTVLLRDLNPAAFNYDLHVAGQVGIGTTSPAAKLHVDNTTGGDDIKFETSTDHDLNFVLEAGTSNNQFTLRIPDEVDRLEFMADSNIRMTLLDNGNFGIGTTNPTDNLTVGDGTSSVGITINKSVSGTGTLEFENAGTDKCYIRCNATEDLIFGTGDSDRVSILESGLVGVGTTSPSGRLEVRESSTSTPVLRLTDAGVANYDFLFPSTDTLKLQCNTTSSKKFILTNEGTGQFNFVLFGGRMMLSGYSSDALSKIHIREAANLGTNFQAARNGDTAIRFDIPNFHSDIVVPMIEAASNNNNALPPAVRIASQFTNNGSNLIFGTSNSYASGVNNSALTIKWDARIGLNQQAPAATLDVWKSPRHTTNDIRLRRADNHSLHCDWVYNSGTCQFGTGGGDHLSFRTNNTNRIYIHGSSGNVGINKAGPAYTLDVNGTVRCETLIFKDGTSFSSVGAVGMKAIAVNIGNGSSNVAGRAKSVVDASYGGIQNGMVLVYYYYHYHSRCGNGGCTRTAYAKQAYQVTDGDWVGIFGF